MPAAQKSREQEESKMQINTRFGMQEIDPASVIRFPTGLAGFEELREFKLFHEESKANVFYLQSVEDPQVQFPVITPGSCQVSYECTLSDEESRLLELDDNSQVAVLVTLAKGSSDQGNIHANFMGPIFLNVDRRVALQKPLNEISGSVVIRAE